MKWEYTTVEIGTTSFWEGVVFKIEEIDEQTNQMGAEGWELVSTVSLNEGPGYSKSVLLFFKRPLND